MTRDLPKSYDWTTMALSVSHSVYSSDIGLCPISRAVGRVGGGGGGGRGGRTTPPFLGQIIFISFVKCKGRDQCKKNPFKN